MSRRRAGEPYVYFIRRSDGEGPIKIGCSSTPETRLKQLTAWAPYPLAILATIPGDEGLEWRFHAAFAASHRHGEWFDPTPRLLLTIAEVKARTFDVAGLPEGARLTSRRKRGWSEHQKLAASISHRLTALHRRGVDVPRAVSAASYRYSNDAYLNERPGYQPADARFCQEFLAAHGYEPRPIPTPDTQERAA